MAFTALVLAPLAMLHAAEKPTTPELTIGLSLQTRSEDGMPKLVRESSRTKNTAIIVCECGTCITATLRRSEARDGAHERGHREGTRTGRVHEAIRN